MLITDIQPERSVMQAMNEINAARRHREAAFEKGEARRETGSSGEGKGEWIVFVLFNYGF